MCPSIAQESLGSTSITRVDWNALDESEFRAATVQFVEAYCPKALRHLQHRPRWAEVKPWYLLLARHGRLAPGWPVQYKGMGLTPARHLLYIEEMERCGAPWMPDSGVRNLGPALIAYGSEEHKQTLLPAIFSGEQVWCQGYSEPGSGSDLASLRTRGRLEGDELVIDGHKIWTTAAFDATHMFALVRTDPQSEGKSGISFVLLDMKQPGIEVRPIRNMAGEEEFCEVFLNSARTPLSNIVGGLHKGWNVARSLLGFERVWAGSPRKALSAIWRIEDLLARRLVTADPALLDRLAQTTMDVLDLQSLYARFANMLLKGDLGPEVSALKIWATETSQRVSELLLEISGEEATMSRAGDSSLLAPFYETRTPTIFSGTNQIQRNILARQVLELP